MRQCFTARQHLRRSVEFATVRAKGRRVDCGAFILQLLVRADLEEGAPVHRKLGVIASKRVGPAVARNRARRAMREIFRLNQESLPQNCDVVMVARASIDRYGFDELQRRYLNACKRAAKVRRGAAKVRRGAAKVRRAKL